MSDYRTKVGKIERLRKFDSEEDFEMFFEPWCMAYLEYYFNVDCEKSSLKPEDLLCEYFNAIDQEMIVANNSVWVITNSETEDDQDSYCHLKELYEDEFEFRTRFYDGGTCESEMIRDEIERLKL